MRPKERIVPSLRLPESEQLANTSQVALPRTLPHTTPRFLQTADHPLVQGRREYGEVYAPKHLGKNDPNNPGSQSGEYAKPRRHKKMAASALARSRTDRQIAGTLRPMPWHRSICNRSFLRRTLQTPDHRPLEIDMSQSVSTGPGHSKNHSLRLLLPFYVADIRPRPTDTKGTMQ
ncbi:hypothetical protein TRP8649_01871 [Pelagimonas phthalicica]|uniref:Uncharacterized protein n=1 Tax=Pelagimonas phthalicica TaxID=1037362 RepID=A0A238JAM2_9RHOB|nr:hypothetical protein CLV87_0201 [Pelagimonas phthalicica]SMX27761.1 hypothetical protein TRP8649_01871 [Pelagimonas phthalicica]